MARAPNTPGIGHNSMPDHSDIRSALAMEMLFEEKEAALRKQKKQARSRMVEGKGITQDDLKFLKNLKEKTPSEVIESFKRQWHNVGAIYSGQFEQMDLFSKKSDAPTRAAYYTMGLMLGLQGKELEVPPMVVGDDRQQVIDGHNEGRERRAAATLDAFAEAVDPKNAGKVIDGTTGKAKDVNDKAAADFAEDQKAAGAEDPLVVNGEKYATLRQANAARKRLEIQGGGAPEPVADEPAPAPEPEPGFLNDTSTSVVGDDVVTGDGTGDALPPLEDGAVEQVGAAIEPPPKAAKRPVPQPDYHAWAEDWTDWTGAQTAEFRRWVESLPAGEKPPITHEGAADFYRTIMEELESSAPAAPPSVPDEASIAAGVEALKKSGFAPNKPARGIRGKA